MRGFHVLDGRDPGQRRRWLELWSSMEERVPFAHPDYVELFAEGGTRPTALVYETEGTKVLFPVLLRPLSAEPWAEGRTEWDMETPYGYGGAFFEGADVKDGFFEEVGAFARARGVVSLFARLSLFPSRTLDFPGEVRFRRMNIVRKLGGDEHSILASYAHKVRKNVKRARSCGLRVGVDRCGRHLEEFLAIYRDTMKRRHAASFYRFSDAFFRKLLRSLSASALLFHVFDQERLVASELVLLSTRSLYSFLGGTAAEAFAQRPNDLLKHEIILYGSREGYETFVLGGGYRPDDGIFRYKQAFARDGKTPFYTGQMVFLEEKYDELCDVRRKWVSKQGDRWRPDPEFFPLYRGEPQGGG